MIDVLELLKEEEMLEKSIEAGYEKMDDIVGETRRVAWVAHHSSAILDNIDAKFDKYTGLTKRDQEFLFVAVALQAFRQYVLTRFEERLDDQLAAKKVLGSKDEHSNRHHRYYNPSLEEIITNPVPYDANIGANGALAGGGKLGHRVTALGHDPLIGLIVGTANIATSTLTTNKFRSFHITTNDNGRDRFGNHAKTSLVFIKTKDKLFNEGKDGKIKVGTSLMKEIRHLKSDVNTKRGLPLPVISVINPHLASELAVRGIDLSNAITIGKQRLYSQFINSIIAMLHGLYYDESVDGSRRLYDVRTSKILTYSNTIASASNFISTSMQVCMGNADAVRNLDIGGILTTLHKISSHIDYMHEIKCEFIEDEFFSLIRGEKYN